MKILLTGKTGQIGWELQRTLCSLGEVMAPGSAEMNLADPDAIRRIVGQVKPDLIVNAAAYTAVDRAESEPALAMAINGVAPGVLAEEAHMLGAMLVHYSTDYVFDGSQASPYKEGDATNPENIYGKTKLAGEQAIVASGCRHLVFRTSWIYGLRGSNFLLTMQRLLEEGPALRVVNDQTGAPTWSRLIASATHQALSGRGLDAEGIFHMACSGRASWYDFAAAIRLSMLERGQSPAALLPVASAEYAMPAKRPANSCLDTSHIARELSVHMPDWQDMLALCLGK